MGIKKKVEIVEDGLSFDSNEELYFYWWLSVLKENGFIDKIEFQPVSFELSEKVCLQHEKKMKKVENKTEYHTIMQPHKYTTDYKVFWNTAAKGIFYIDIKEETLFEKRELPLFKAQNSISYFEVKPSFDQNNMTRLATINIKWVWDKFGIFVNILIPEKVFAAYFTPERFLLQNKTKRPRTIKYKPVLSLEQYISTRL